MFNENYGYYENEKIEELYRRGEADSALDFERDDYYENDRRYGVLHYE